MGHLEQQIFVLGIFTILMIAYGQSIGGPNMQQSLNNVFGPWPALKSVSLDNCIPGDVICSGNNVAKATAWIAVAIEYPAILLFTALGRFSTFLSLYIGILFGPQAATLSIPFFNLFFPLIITVAGLEIFRMARGNASAGTL